MRSKQSIIASTLGTVALIATFSLAGGTAANAAPSNTGTDTAAPSCWLDLSTGASLCVPAGSDLVAAVQAETGISIVVPDGLTIGGVSAKTSQADVALFGAASASTSEIVSALYDDVNYGGGTFLLDSAGPGCSWGLSNLGSYGWNDRASSFKSFNGCKTAVFHDINFGGTKLGYSTNKASFGSMNDAASSWATE